MVGIAFRALVVGCWGISLAGFVSGRLTAGEIGRGGVYSVVDVAFRGPDLGPADTPARDVSLRVRFRHESGSTQLLLNGFWDGDGRGGTSGNVFKVRFCPTLAGRWELAQVDSNLETLKGQHQGDFVTARPSSHHGFWIIDPDSPGRRWYRRSDASHPYIVGNTQYTFVSGYRDGGQPTGVTIAQDVARNAEYFKKLRFSLLACRYPHPTLKPFLDDAGRPTDNGDWSHRPNPAWFHDRIDVAVQAAFHHDLIADLILCGPDTESARSTLRAAHNGGDPSPYLRYVAARYGSYPNVWLCLCNEFDIKTPRYSASQMTGFGSTVRQALPYPTPLSVHSAPPGWPPRFDDLPPWNDHQIIQHKLRRIGPAADAIRETWTGPTPGRPRDRPTINDELSYQGEGDGHSEADTIAAHLGVFLGGGYGTTGDKPANKCGSYFWGAFDPATHTAADNLQWLRQTIDDHVTFWRMAPDESIFEHLAPGFRGLAWPGHEYALGTDEAHAAIVAQLPHGRWTVRRYDVMAHEATTLSEAAEGRFVFDAPASRAVLFHFLRNAPVVSPEP
jgi:hypothetical protein